MLSDIDIRKALSVGDLAISPLDPKQIQPASIDLLLGDTFAALPPDTPDRPGYIDPCAPPLESHQVRTIQPGRQFPLPPHGFVLAHTVETVSIGKALAGRVAGKSSLARCGLIVESAGFVDPGFSGQLTLELANLTDRTILLTPGMRICQLTIDRLETPTAIPYGSDSLGSHYQGQTGPTPSRYHL